MELAPTVENLVRCVTELAELSQEIETPCPALVEQLGAAGVYALLELIKEHAHTETETIPCYAASLLARSRAAAVVEAARAVLHVEFKLVWVRAEVFESLFDSAVLNELLLSDRNFISDSRKLAAQWSNGQLDQFLAWAARHTGAPVISSIDHVNLVVSNLPRMLAFYRDVLGFTPTKHVTISGDWIGSTVGLENVSAEVVYLDLPAGPRIELLRYITPDAVRVPGVDRPNALGLRHLAFKVDDVDAAASKLRAAGVEFFSDVQSVPDSQVTYAGSVRKRLVYFRDPEGNILELCEYR